MPTNNKLQIKLMLYRKHLILAAHNDGFSIKDITEIFKLSRQYVYKVVRSK